MIIAEPTERAKEIVKGMENPENWKLPLTAYCTSDAELASEVEYAVGFYHGGFEVNTYEKGFCDCDTCREYDGRLGPFVNIVKRITSLGYYHYIGA